MATVLGVWESFGGGHWGNKGPEQAASNQFGGVNMIVTESGGVMPMSASRKINVTNMKTGVADGIFWAWGADGKVYYLQEGDSTLGTSSTRATVFSFTPAAGDVTQTEVGGVSGPVTYQPDWAGVGLFVYVTVWGDKTYRVSTALSQITALTGTYGNAPAGRCIALYGERLVVGGVSDARFGVHANRIVFSGDDTGNDVTNLTAWESLNYFDLGADGTPITALYPARDHLIVVLEDQQVYLITGVLGSTAIARRIYGFHKGSGAIAAYVANNGAVDPDQSRVWMFDHTQRAPANLTGTQWSKLAGWGAPHSSRTGTDITEGTMTMVGGPDELVMYGVAAGRQAGEGVVNNRLFLNRVNGAFGLGQRVVIGLPASQSSDTTPTTPTTAVPNDTFMDFDASAANTITSTTNVVSLWTNTGSVGSGLNFTPAGVVGPFTGTRTIGGVNALDFTAGGGREMYMAGTPTVAQPFTIYIVFQSDTGVGALLENSTTGHIIGISASANGYITDGTTTLTTAGGVTVDTPCIIRAVFAGGASSVRVNNGTVVTGTLLTTSLFAGVGGPYLSANDGVWYDGLISRLRGYARQLSAAEDSVLMTDLASTWGITL